MISASENGDIFIWNFDKEEFKTENAFSSYIIGKPFISDDIVQIPVRLTSEKGKVTIMVYLWNDGKYLINQIEIKRWDNNYGK